MFLQIQICVCTLLACCDLTTLRPIVRKRRREEDNKCIVRRMNADPLLINVYDIEHKPRKITHTHSRIIDDDSCARNDDNNCFRRCRCVG